LVQIAPLPHGHATRFGRTGIAMGEDLDTRFDVLLRRTTSHVQKADAAARRELYESDSVFAVSKRQLARREMKAYGLTLPGG
jgi:hypothetical protein